MLSERERQTLLAVATCVLQGAPLASERVAPVCREVERRLQQLAADKRRGVRIAFALLALPPLGWMYAGRPRAFAALTIPEQERWLTGWMHSRLPELRTAAQALRRLIVGTHYADQEVAARIGHAGPLHRRKPEVAWEGPLPDADTSAVRRSALPTGLVRGRTLTHDVVRTADAVVIGSGAGGAVAAARLAEAGLDVVVLEDGAYFMPDDFTEVEQPLTEQLYAEGALRATDDLGVQMLQGRSVGGSTTVNWMIMLRTPEFVLDEWERLFGLSMYSAQSLAPVFERIEREVHATPVPDNAHSPNNRIVLDGARALGWSARGAVINARGCVRSGTCGIGCRYDAKQSTLLTYLPSALARGATVYSDVRVERIAVRERDTGLGKPPLKRVHAAVSVPSDAPGPTHKRHITIDAPIVVVAGGAVETPLLLQRSGLGGGAVGKNLRLHPTTAVLGVYDRDIVGSTGIPLSTVCDEHLRWQGTDYGFWLECPPLLPGLGAVAVPGFGRDHASVMHEFRRLGSIIALTRDGANVHHSSGQVRARRDGSSSITYRLHATDQERVRASIVAAVQLHLAAGAREVITLHDPPVRVTADSANTTRQRMADDLARQIATAPIAANRLGLFSAHVNGTCRLGTDARRAGVNPEGELFGARGVYVCDGSLLPSAPSVNPQETIMALASQIADGIARRFR